MLYVSPIAHFRVALNLLLKPRPSEKTVHMDIYFYFHMKENSFPYEWFCTWPRFEKEAKSNSEKGYCLLTHVYQSIAMHCWFSEVQGAGGVVQRQHASMRTVFM